MKKWLLVAALAFAGYVAYQERASGPSAAGEVEAAASAAAIDEAASGTQVQGTGVVSRILADDDAGSRHQRFILRLPSGQTVLVAHNIDLAPRVEGLREGDTVDFSGEFEWNPQGGVVHWTHRDPAGRHVAGWLEHDGQRVQ